METLLRATQLGHAFGAHPVLTGVDLSLRTGQVVGLLGPNGAGKTTCLRLLSGLLAPHEGQIELLGIDLLQQPRLAQRHIGYLPERPPVYTDLRVDEYLRFCARLHGVPARRTPEAVEEAKFRCGLEDTGRKLIGRLSKGYRQRLGLAQAIIHRPALLILDEPTDGLDPLQMRELRGLIRALAEDTGILLSSHLLPEVQAVCDRVLILHQGRVALEADLRAPAPTNVWRVKLGLVSYAERLMDIPQVHGVVALGEDRYRVDLDDRASAADLAREIVDAGLELYELIPERSDLERVFFDLLGVEEPAT